MIFLHLHIFRPRIFLFAYSGYCREGNITQHRILKVMFTSK